MPTSELGVFNGGSRGLVLSGHVAASTAQSPSKLTAQSLLQNKGTHFHHSQINPVFVCNLFF